MLRNSLKFCKSQSDFQDYADRKCVFAIKFCVFAIYKGSCLHLGLR